VKPRDLLCKLLIFSVLIGVKYCPFSIKQIGCLLPGRLLFSRFKGWNNLKNMPLPLCNYGKQHTRP
jgi:hypothetical protein